jgi:hypothetical protein
MCARRSVERLRRQVNLWIRFNMFASRNVPSLAQAAEECFISGGPHQGNLKQVI